MYEVEVKVRAAHDEVRERLQAAGATRVGRVTQRDTYFDAPHRDFATSDEALRVRRETGEPSSTHLTYKGPRVEAESKTRIERETAVEDAEETAAILEALGFSRVATVEKVRERYRVEDYLVALDDVEGLGEFVEVETEVAADIEAAREGANALLADLGLDPAAGIRTSYLGLLLDGDE